jgi:hypothetical protein
VRRTALDDHRRVVAYRAMMLVTAFTPSDSPSSVRGWPWGQAQWTKSGHIGRNSGPRRIATVRGVGLCRLGRRPSGLIDHPVVFRVSPNPEP